MPTCLIARTSGPEHALCDPQSILDLPILRFAEVGFTYKCTARSMKRALAMLNVSNLLIAHVRGKGAGQLPYG
jgi:hypothetical protein